MPLNEAADRSEVRVLDPAVEAEIVRRIDAAKKAGDTLGGEVEVVARGVVVGPGQPRELGPEARRAAGRDADVDPGGQGRRDRDGRSRRRAGRAPRCTIRSKRGSRTARPRAAGRPPRRLPAADQQRRRARGRDHHRGAGGCQGGDEADLHPDVPPAHRGPRVGRAGQRGQSERSDVTAVPAMGVIAEAMVALVLADAMLEKFGGDSLAEMRRNYDGYVAALGSRWARAAARRAEG